MCAAFSAGAGLSGPVAPAWKRRWHWSSRDGPSPSQWPKIGPHIRRARWPPRSSQGVRRSWRARTRAKAIVAARARALRGEGDLAYVSSGVLIQSCAGAGHGFASRSDAPPHVVGSSTHIKLVLKDR